MAAKKNEKFEHPIFKTLLERHSLDKEILDQAVEKHGVDPGLLARLLDLAYTKYRTLDAWGGKAEFKRDLESILRDYTK